MKVSRKNSKKLKKYTKRLVAYSAAAAATMVTAGNARDANAAEVVWDIADKIGGFDYALATRFNMLTGATASTNCSCTYATTYIGYGTTTTTTTTTSGATNTNMNTGVVTTSYTYSKTNSYYNYMQVNSAQGSFGLGGYWGYLYNPIADGLDYYGGALGAAGALQQNVNVPGTTNTLTTTSTTTTWAAQSALAKDAAVNGALTFGGSNYSYSSFGQWNDLYDLAPGASAAPVPGYLGVAFKIGADTHYGWVELDFVNYHYTLKAFGYDDVAGSRSLTGGNDPDINSDGIVDGLDLGILLGSWGGTTNSAGGELNEDGNVDGLDLGILLGAWGAAPLSAASVPEPSSIFLLAAGAVGLGSWRRRKAVA
jgi:hypothetical protein